MTNLAQTLYNTNHISAVAADKAKSQFAVLMVDAKDKFKDDCEFQHKQGSTGQALFSSNWQQSQVR